MHRKLLALVVFAVGSGFGQDVPMDDPEPAIAAAPQAGSYNGSNSYKEGGTDGMDPNGAFSVFAKVRTTAGHSGDRAVWSFTNLTRYYRATTRSTTNWRCSEFGNLSDFQTAEVGGVFTQDQKAIVGCIFPAVTNTRKACANGICVSGGGDAGSMPALPVTRIGTNEGGTQWWNGDILEVCIFNREMTDQDYADYHAETKECEAFPPVDYKWVGVDGDNKGTQTIGDFTVNNVTPIPW